jgi:cytoskeleton protein RodZ
MRIFFVPAVGPSFGRCYTHGLQVEGMARGNFGERLKRERELREVTLEEITSATRIGPRFLEALENEDWEKLPGGVFNRGFVRSVARYLGLDEESFLAEYDLAHGPIVQPPPEHSANHFSSRPKWVPFLAFLLFLAVLGGLLTSGVYAWRFYAAHRAVKQSSLPPMTSSGPGTFAPNPDVFTNVPAGASGLNVAAENALQQLLPDLFVSLSAATDLRIVADGKILIDAELPSGTNRLFPGGKGFEPTAANSSSVLMKLNGRAMPPLGAAGASGTMALNRRDLRPTSSGNSQP